MESANPTNPVRPSTPPAEQPQMAPPAAGSGPTTNAPQTRGQNPDNAHQGAERAEATTTAPDDATSRGEYGSSRQEVSDKRNSSAAPPEGGGQSNPAPTTDQARAGGGGGYTNAAASQGATNQGVGSRGGSYNDEYSNSPQPAEAGREATDRGSTTGAASGLINTGPDQQRAARQAQDRQTDPGPDSGGASTGRAPITNADSNV